jgi:hypothetical protein
MSGGGNRPEPSAFVSTVAVITDVENREEFQETGTAALSPELGVPLSQSAI